MLRMVSDPGNDASSLSQEINIVSKINIQFNPFIPKTGFNKKGGFKIPSATSTAVTIDKKIKTPQIFCWLDLNVNKPLNIESLCY